jgi:hypothetical protein
MGDDHGDCGGGKRRTSGSLIRPTDARDLQLQRLHQHSLSRKLPRRASVPPKHYMNHPPSALPHHRTSSRSTCSRPAFLAPHLRIALQHHNLGEHNEPVFRNSFVHRHQTPTEGNQDTPTPLSGALGSQLHIRHAEGYQGPAQVYPKTHSNPEHASAILAQGNTQLFSWQWQ